MPEPSPSGRVFLNPPHRSPPNGPAVEACPRPQRATGSSLHENGSAHQGARIRPDNGRFQNPDRNQSGSFFFQGCFLLQTRCLPRFSRPIPRQSFETRDVLPQAWFQVAEVPHDSMLLPLNDKSPSTLHIQLL